ncbi:hypothetical protein BGV48_12160 [Burkholderia ubonensis]|nr:hypothetical protein BGV48_12160 [Burkholderia ubonensis]
MLVRLSILDKPLQFFNGQNDIVAVEHRMTVRADGTQIGDRIDLMFFLVLGQRSKVMYVNETLAQRTILCAEIEGADNTRRSPVLDTLSASFGISLVTIHRYLLDAAFAICFPGTNLLWKPLTGGRTLVPRLDARQQSLRQRCVVNLFLRLPRCMAADLRERHSIAQIDHVMDPVDGTKMPVIGFIAIWHLVLIKESIRIRGSHDARPNEAMAISIGEHPITFRHVMQDHVASISLFAVKASGNHPHLSVSLPPFVGIRAADVENVISHRSWYIANFPKVS